MNCDESVESGRLKRLPPRLRVAHLAALVRWERAINALSYPSPAECVGREGRSVAEARVGGISLCPHPAHPSPSLTMIPRASFARLGPPRKGEGSSTKDGPHG
jgi:hypothetical protein